MQTEKITTENLSKFGFELLPDENKGGVEVAYSPNNDIRMIFNPSEKPVHDYWITFFNGEMQRITYIEELKDMLAKEHA